MRGKTSDYLLATTNLARV